jgi:23S rRNA pseudouridine1911/1915/1917 synthase
MRETQQVTVIVPAHHSGMRLDVALSALIPALSRRDAQKLCAEGQVRLQGRRASKSALVSAGNELIVTFGPSRVASPIAAILAVRLATQHWVIVAKPALVPTAPKNSAERNTLANALVYAYPEMANVGYRALEPGLLHRLDNGTSGLLVAARTQAAFEHARDALKRSEWSKSYFAIVKGGKLPGSGVVSGELVPDPEQPKRVKAKGTVELLQANSFRADNQRLSPFQTGFETVAESEDLSLLRIFVGPAFRHQIRAHFAAVGCPLLNDEIYGAARDPRLEPGRHALHAARVAWVGEPPFEGFDVTEPLAADLSALFERPSSTGV